MKLKGCCLFICFSSLSAQPVMHVSVQKGFPVFSSQEITRGEPQSKKKRSIFVRAFNLCLKLLKAQLSKLIAKEIKHIITHLPRWIERMQWDKILFRSSFTEESLSPSHIVSLIDFLKKQSPSSFALPLHSHIAIIEKYTCDDDKKRYIERLLEEEESTLELLDDLLYFLCSSLHFKSMDDVKKYYTSLISTEQ